MGYNVAEKIISSHLVNGSMTTGREISLRVDSTLVHDLSGLLAYIGFESLDIPSIVVSKPYTFLDHNLISTDHQSMDGHVFIRSAAKKYGSFLSLAGNGICHSLYYSRFGVPGTLLIGADSHCSTAGALGMLGIGLGGLDITVIMSGEPYCMKMPPILNIHLTGILPKGCCAKDIILTILNKISVKGGIGKIIEYNGDGVLGLTVPQRATIANMGAETGAISSVFPSDQRVREFLESQDRMECFNQLLADGECCYSEILEIDLGTVCPMAAMPSMPDNAAPVSALSDIRVNQVYIGSCANGSYTDIARAAKVLEGKRVHPDVALLVSPGTRQVFQMLLRDGYIKMMVDAGARILECGCGPCIGLGQAPPTDGVSVRTSNRNYIGRSGTKSAQVYLTGTETAAATAVTGFLTQACQVVGLDVLEQVSEPTKYIIDDSMVQAFTHDPTVGLIKGPGIKPMPVAGRLDKDIDATVILKTGDGITTDDIIPPSAEVLALRANIPALSEYLFNNLDCGFSQRARTLGNSIVVGGENYGQGSSREHAAIAPMFLGVKAVLAKSISRIHRSNLINYGILPMTFTNPCEYNYIEQGDELSIINVPKQLETQSILLENKTGKRAITATIVLSERERNILLAGGLLPYIRAKRHEGMWSSNEPVRKDY